MKNSFSLYLAKEQYTQFEDLLTENAQHRMREPSSHILDLPAFAEGARLYITSGFPSTPAWVSRLQAQFEFDLNVTTSSASGVLIFRVQGRLFVTTFASGWMQLNDRALEADFGLRVAINGLDDTKLKRLERANLGDALRGVHLSPFQRDLNSFGVDEALDLIRKVSGQANDETAADTMSGAQSLKITGDFVLADLPDIAVDSLTRFQSIAYRQTSFRVLDVVRPVSDRDIIGRLDQIVVDHIKTADRADFELGLPITYDDQAVEYRFVGANLRGTHADLTLNNYTSSLGPRLEDITIETLKQHKIVARFNEDENQERPWSIRTALVGSVVMDDGLYAINEGAWYRLDDTFRNSVTDAFHQAVFDWNDVDEPRPLIIRANRDGTRLRYEAEAAYNIDVAHTLGLVCMDTELISVPEIANSAFEACDLLDVSRKRLIHVKKSSRRSSVLSHFFKQGANSAQNMRWYPDVINRIGDKVAEKADETTRDRLLAAHADEQRKWTVEYWLADVPRADGDFNIPFFSKVTLRDERKKMLAMNYDVKLRFISMTPPRDRI